MYRISSCGQLTRCGPPVWVLGEVLTTHSKNLQCYRAYIRLGLILCYDASSGKVKQDLLKLSSRKGMGQSWAGLIWLSNRDRWQVLVNVVMKLQVR
jgi:hypothetical protein